jgi:hypothetical protein
MKTYREFIIEVGDWWHPDPKKDKLMPGRGPKLRARQDREPKPDYSNKLKPGETYMQFAKRKTRGESVEYVDELFVTKKSSEDQKKKKVAELIRLMKAAKDPLSDAPARRKKINANEEYIDETSLTRVMSKSKKGGMAIMSAQRGDKSKAENKARSKQLEKDVRGAGLPGPTKVAGRYTENPGTPQEKKVGEKSHIITPGKKGKRKFKKAIEKLGKKYDQDSVLLQRKAGGSSTLKGTSKTSWPGKGKNVKIGSMKPGRTGEFDTKVKNKTFTVED